MSAQPTPDPIATDLKAAIGGDVQAQVRVYEHFKSAIYAYVLRGVAGRSDVEADDVFMEVWLAAFKDIHKAPPEPARFRAWVFTIARNRLLAVYRGSDRSRQHSAPEELGADGSAPLDEQIYAAEVLRLTWACIERCLTERERYAVRGPGGPRTSEETAEVLGVTRTNALQILSRARRKLRDCLMKQGVLR